MMWGTIIGLAILIPIICLGWALSFWAFVTLLKEIRKTLR